MRKIRPRAYFGLLMGVAVVGIAFAVTIQLLNPSTKDSGLPVAASNSAANPSTDGDDRPALTGHPGARSWLLLDTRTVDKGVQFNIEQVVAVGAGIHVFYSIVANDVPAANELIPYSFKVRDEQGKEHPILSHANLGNVNGVSIGVITLGPYVPRSHTFTLNVPELTVSDGEGENITGSWQLTFLERLQPEIRQMGSDVLRAKDEDVSLGLKVWIDATRATFAGHGHSTQRFAITNLDTGVTTYVPVEISGREVAAISPERYSEIFQRGREASEAMRAKQMERAYGVSGTDGSTTGLVASEIPTIPDESVYEAGAFPLGPGAELWIAAGITASAGDSIVVPIHLTPNDNSVASLAFSVDYDESTLSFDGTDADEDGVPEAISFIVPESFDVYAGFDETNTDGELDFAVFNVSPTGDALPEGVLVEITFAAKQAPPLDAPVIFSKSPRASFGDPYAKDIRGTTKDGVVQIAP